LQLSEVFRPALGGFLAADPAGLGYDEFLWNGFPAVWAFHSEMVLRGLLLDQPGVCGMKKSTNEVIADLASDAISKRGWRAKVFDVQPSNKIGFWDIKLIGSGSKGFSISLHEGSDEENIRTQIESEFDRLEPI
jgi:hypothetical protein